MRRLVPGVLLFAFVGIAAAADASSPSSNAPEKPCRETAGAEKAKRLAAQCLEVSPAMHPPCNAANACSLILDEIARGCAMIEKGAPAFCAKHANGD
jgi:hypothetical protein